MLSNPWHLGSHTKRCCFDLWLWQNIQPGSIDRRCASMPLAAVQVLSKHHQVMCLMCHPTMLPSTAQEVLMQMQSGNLLDVMLHASESLPMIVTGGAHRQARAVGAGDFPVQP